MHWLGKEWENVKKELTDNVDYTTEITYPSGKVVPCGNLRVVRISQAEGKLKLILLHDRFNKYQA